MTGHKRVEVVVFNGVKFRRYPDAPGLAERRYYVPGVADRQRGVKRLHEEIWMAEHGREIPAGHHIHHKDGDALNNDPSNLVCITEEEHKAHHGDQPRSEAQRAWWAEYQQRATEWHGSEEGRAWHSQHGKQTWENHQPHDRTCDQCGKPFQTRSIATAIERFCSNACKSAARRASRLDQVDRSCEFCGATFQANRYSKTRFCSRSCSTRHQHAKRAPGGAA